MGTLDYLLKAHPVTLWLNHRNLYLLGLATIACGLAWSNALMSIGQFILIGNWIIELDFKRKLHRLKINKIFWTVSALYFIHVVGLIWTSDFHHAEKDLVIKLPLIALPFVIASSPAILWKEWKPIFIIYLTTLFLLSLASLVKYLRLFGYDYVDKRELSVYISHIRYGLNFAVATILIWFWKMNFTKPYRLLLISLIIWFITCLFLFQLITGLVVVSILAINIVIQIVYKRINSRHKLELITLSLLALGVVCFFYVKSVYKDYTRTPDLNYDQFDDSEQFTLNGEKYWSEFKDRRKENGVYVRRFIAWKEIEKEWNKRSELEFWSPDLKNQTLDQTLNRYLSSKGLRKDSVGIAQLSDAEIAAIEKGVANVYYLENNPIRSRIFKTFYELDEFKNTGRVNGFSLVLRWFYWKIGVNIFSENVWIGVGTGDLPNEYEKAYNNDSIQIDEIYKRRSHNQLLNFAICFGVLGLLLILFSIFYPVLSLQKNQLVAYFIISILLISFLTEDTLETQAGVTLYAFFYALFILGFSDFQRRTVE